MDLLSVQPASDFSIYGNLSAAPSTGEYFAENFWGEKNLGFNVLYHNMKHGQISVKDLQDFIRESANAEELYAKHMTKLAKQASNCSAMGTFSPLMDVLKVMTEKISSCHMDIVLKLQDIIKDLSKYFDEQKVKHKHSKDNFSSTAEALHNLQTATNAVNKSKEKYNQICMEEERLKAPGNAQQKELEKAASKSRKAREEYKALVGKHAIARHQFEEKMFHTAQEFQKIEKEHLLHMKSVLDGYILSFENAHVLVNQVHQEFRRQMGDNTVERLLQEYAEQKGTGTNRPTTIVYEEFKAENVPSNVIENGTQSFSATPENLQAIPPPPMKSKKETGIFGIRRRRAKAKNDVSTNSSSSKDSKDAESMGSPDKEPEYRVDEEGYTIRPESPDRSNKNSFHFSSDSDSDSDSDDVSHRKIQVRINPINESTAESGGSDLETLNAITRSLTLGTPSPSIPSKKFSPPEEKRAQNGAPATQPTEKLSNDDLLDLFDNTGKNFTTKHNETRPQSIRKEETSKDNLDLFANFKPTSKPDKDRTRSITKKGPAPPIPITVAHSESAKSLDELLTMSNMDSTSDINPDIPPPRPPKPSGPTPSFVHHDRPTDLDIGVLTKFETKETARSYSAPLASSESWSSLSSAGGAGTPGGEMATPGFGSISRGPSPLTLSHTDNIPIAVAFTETVNAYFKGDEESKTLTKTTGEMQISFPAGITRAFTSNPDPPILSFKIICSNASSLSGITHDPKLLRKEAFLSEGSVCAYSFDMASLVAHIKKMTEEKPNSPHYNIHIISYVVPSSYQKLPLHLSSSWQCDPKATKIKIDYKYNSAATSSPLQSLNVLVPVQGTITNVQSTPRSVWNSVQNRLCWQIPTKVSQDSATGTLESTLTMDSGPSKPNALAVQFLSEGNVLSGIDFELSGTGYRISLVKKRFITGKYLCDSS